MDREGAKSAKKRENLVTDQARDYEESATWNFLCISFAFFAPSR
jgi:hypothetical protein